MANLILYKLTLRHTHTHTHTHTHKQAIRPTCERHTLQSRYVQLSSFRNLILLLFFVYLHYPKSILESVRFFDIGACEASWIGPEKDAECNCSIFGRRVPRAFSFLKSTLWQWRIERNIFCSNELTSCTSKVQAV